MWQSFDDVSRYGKEFMDSGLKSFASVSRGAQTLAAETSDFSKKSFEAGSQAFEKLVSARSIESAVEIQMDFAKQTYESMIAEATRLGEIYADIAKEAYKPYEAIVTRAK